MAEYAFNLDNGKTFGMAEIPNASNVEKCNNFNITVKAGTQLFIPNGKDSNGVPIFEEYVLTEDEISYVPTMSTRDNYIYLVKPFETTWNDPENFESFIHAKEIFAGPTAPEEILSQGYWAVWYDTTNNIMMTTDDSGETWNPSKVSLPICAFTVYKYCVDTINVVMNGISWIGDTVFLLPGCKYVVADKRTEEGKLNSIDVTIDQPIVCTQTGSAQYLDLDSNKDVKKIMLFEESTTEPQSTDSVFWYNPQENSTTYINNDIREETPQCLCCHLVKDDQGLITNTGWIYSEEQKPKYLLCRQITDSENTQISNQSKLYRLIGNN